MFYWPQPVLYRGQGKRKRRACRNRQPSQRLRNAPGGKVTGLWPHMLPKGLYAMLPVFLALIRSSLKSLRKGLGRLLKPLLWQCP